MAAYLAAAVLTTHISPRGVRPLFEGFQPPPAYRWVKPPPDLAAANQKPSVLNFDVAVSAQGSKGKAGDVDTSQIILNLPDGAFPSHGADTSVTMTATPVDPATVGPPPPPGQQFQGNAYRITAVYKPSGAATGPMATPGNIILRYPTHATTLLFTPDGKAWQTLKTLDFGGGNQQLGGDLAQLGTYVLAGPPVQSNAPPKPKKPFPVGAAIGGGAAAIAVLLVLIASRNRGRR